MQAIFFKARPTSIIMVANWNSNLMSMMKYDVVTIRKPRLSTTALMDYYAQMPNAKFEFVSANYGFKNTVLDGHIKPYTIKTDKWCKNWNFRSWYRTRRLG
jgi:2',3'-cyclic-nucleotide 2'-phosphodiesterase (5'-nucleotidase family)